MIDYSSEKEFLSHFNDLFYQVLILYLLMIDHSTSNHLRVYTNIDLWHDFISFVRLKNSIIMK